jgi:predicted O-methyltransferase YrrM
MSHKTKIKLNKDAIGATDVSSLLKYIDWCESRKYFELDPGNELYKLLACVSKQVDSETIIDIGTYYGMSALSLSISDKKVISYDIFDSIPDDRLTIKNKINIEIKYMDCTDEIDIISESDLIFIDIDNSGSQEHLILGMLEKYKYKGLVILDDIHLTEQMKKLWSSIPHEKHDITQYGHWSGTGIINFDPSRFEIILE